MRVLLIDNHDSYTYNLYQLLWRVSGCEPMVIANDAFTLAELEGLDFSAAVISPGPGKPENPRDFGFCADFIRAFPDRAILGVCLGHQGLAWVHGAQVRAARQVRHGKLSKISHDGSGLFAGLPPGFMAVRYHSLAVDSENLPESLQITARAEDDGEIMALQVRGLRHFGLQFHPESVATAGGIKLLSNFLELASSASVSVSPGGIEQSPLPSIFPSSSPFSPPYPHPTPSTPSNIPPAFPLTGRARELISLPWAEPESVFADFFSQHSHAFWLDSARQDSRSRFSYMGSAQLLLELDARSIRLFKTNPVKESPENQKTESSVPTGNLLEERAGHPIQLLRDVLAGLRKGLPDPEPSWPFEFSGGLVGWLTYEGFRFCFDAPAFADQSGTENPGSVSRFLIPDRIIVFDHNRQCAYAIALEWEYPERTNVDDNTGDSVDSPDPSESARNWLTTVREAWDSLRPVPSLSLPEKTADLPLPQHRLNLSRDAYIEAIEKIQLLIRAGETYEICLTNELQADCDADPWRLYLLLRRLNPSPYAAFFAIPGLAVLSSSPERFLRLGRDGQVSSRPIKGTRRRGRDAEEDERLRSELAEGEKERAENLMIADLVRNDLGRVCAPATVEAIGLMVVEAHPAVFQMVTEITGRLAQGKDALDLIHASFPPGSMTGAPKPRSLEIIETLERRSRGIYSGALGWISCEGALDLSVVIRTLVLSDGQARIGCGGAIVHDSNPEAEFDEAMLKARALLQALALEQAIRSNADGGKRLRENRL